MKKENYKITIIHAMFSDNFYIKRGVCWRTVPKFNARDDEIDLTTLI